MENKYLYNCHTHIFNLDCAPEKFIQSQYPKIIADAIELLLKYRASAFFLKGTLKLLGQWKINIKKLYSFIRIGTYNSQDLVFEHLASNYPANTRFIVLTLNMDFMGAGVAKRNYQTQIDQVIEIRKKYPQTCLPFLCIDPRHGDENFLLSLCHKYIYNPSNNTMGGYVGIKLYPSLGFYPFDPILDKVFSFAQKYQIPIITHCTKGGIQAVSPNPLPFSQIFPPFVPDNFQLSVPYEVKSKNADLCDNFLYPPYYEYVLKKFPYLKICFAHLGGSEEILNYSNPDSWYNLIKKIIANENYKNVYADISYTLCYQNANKIIQDELNQNPIFKDRVVFGTDFFLTEVEDNELNLYTKRAINDYGENFNKIAYENCYSTEIIDLTTDLNYANDTVDGNQLFKSFLRSKVY